MKNLAFVLWMVLFPVSVHLEYYLDFLSHGSLVRTWSESTDLIMAAISFAVWVWIGVLLYEPKTKTTEPVK